MRYFLGRVSSKDQNLARQLKLAREKFDIPDENVYCDKITGSSFDRPRYNALKQVVQSGDEVIVKEFDRFGRNKEEMKEEEIRYSVKSESEKKRRERLYFFFYFLLFLNFLRSARKQKPMCRKAVGTNP